MKADKINIGIFFAVLAAALYSLSSPLSKLLLEHIPSVLMAGLLYLGAGIGMSIIAIVRGTRSGAAEEKLGKKELPYTLAMVLLDIAAPIFMLIGLSTTTAASASLLNNFEIVATAVIALAVFRERISPRLWLGILFVTASCILLSFEDMNALNFSKGSLFIIAACICWGFENNCTRKISSKDPIQIVMIKGIFSGAGSLLIGLAIGERITEFWTIPAVLLIGFISYGLSIYFYVTAQRSLGAARTSAYYAVSPFIGTFLSLLIFREIPHYIYFIALFFMAIGAVLSSRDEPIFKKRRPAPPSDPET